MTAQAELTGKHAEVMIGAVKVMDAYEVSIDLSNTFLEPRAFGQVWKKRIPDEGDFTVTAKKYALASNIGNFISLAAQTIDSTRRSRSLSTRSRAIRPRASSRARCGSRKQAPDADRPHRRRHNVPGRRRAHIRSRLHAEPG